MIASVAKTLCGNLPYHSPPEPFTTPTHNYYEALEDTAATHSYLEFGAAKHCTNIINTDEPDTTVKNGDVITHFLQTKVPLAK